MVLKTKPYLDWALWVILANTKATKNGIRWVKGLHAMTLEPFEVPMLLNVSYSNVWRELVWFNFNKHCKVQKGKKRTHARITIQMSANRVLQIQQYHRNTIKSKPVVSLQFAQTPIQVPGRDGRASEMVPMLLPHEIIAATWRAGDVQDWVKTQVILFPHAIWNCRITDPELNRHQNKRWVQG